ncbi:hypothetical protein C8Q72DRAFT_887568 [Fomitopsis betulina]|nr:hypothetical protein C8Q72DRAFT_887568 [Fomitopsis betulina]
MSSPIAIPRTSSSASSRSPSGSPTGVYVPIHRRKASSVAALTSDNANVEKQPPCFVYQITQLRALATSPLVSLTPAQRARLAELSAFISAHPAAGKDTAAGSRRRRAGRRASSAKKLQTEVHVDVESRRRRHGTWGWAAHAGELEREESWRHSSEPAFPVAVRA